MEATNGISIVIPTLNGGDVFSRCLQAIKGQDYDGPVEVIVVDSGSSDPTVARAREAGARVDRIARSEFHHAQTRNSALQHVNFDRVIYMVQDAVPATRTWLKNLARIPLAHPVAAAYGRPTAHENASVYGRFTADGISRYLGSAPRLQALSGSDAYAKMSFDEAYRIARLDNVCAIYRRQALVNCPFPDVPYAEDMAWALTMLLSGAKIRYDPCVVVRHSHERSAAYIFRRHVVDAVYCARILGKLRGDMSWLTVSSLICLTHWAKSRIETMLADDANMKIRELEQPRPKSDKEDFFSSIAATSSLQDQYSQPLVAEKAHRPCAHSESMDEIKSRFGAEVDYLWNFVKKSYTLKDRFDTEDTLEKIAASVLGKFYGDAYASRAANGTLEAEFCDFIDPYLNGI